MPIATVSEREQWASSSLTRLLKEALKTQRDTLKESWATGVLEDPNIMQRARGAIENIDSTLEAINDLSKEEPQDGINKDTLQSSGS